MRRRGQIRTEKSRFAAAILAFAGLAAAVPAVAQCIPDEFSACLISGRYRAQIAWRADVSAPSESSGRVRPLTDNTAAFWFFQPDNLELVLKVLDARAVNGRFWLFAAALTTLEFSLQVTDAETGWKRVWFHPSSTASTEVDIDAFADDPLPGSILFIGAHPDDETLAAPILGRLCVEKRRRCAFLDATRGEAGQCRLASGCTPDLGTVRSGEMQAAASLFGATLTQWALPDVAGPDPAAVRSAWASSSGGDDALVRRVAAAIADAAPDTIISFDPRHGSTCHPAHRALGQLVREALAVLPPPIPAAYLLETRVQSVQNVSDFVFAPIVPEDERAFEFDGNTPRGDRAGETAWSYLVADASAQPSQFPASTLVELGAVPVGERSVRLLPLWAFETDPRYEVCAAPSAASATSETGRRPPQ